MRIAGDAKVEAAVTGWQRRGGVSITAPHAVALAEDSIGLFIVGTDHEVRVQWWDGKKWGDWEPLGGTMIAAPFSVARGSGRLDLFAVSHDHSIQHNIWDGVSWSGWRPLHGEAGGLGLIVASPHAVSWGPDRLDLFVRGTDFAIYHKWLMDEQWSDWTRVGELMLSAPHAVSCHPRHLDLFSIGTDSTLYHAAWRDGGWQRWESLTDSTVTSHPYAVARASGDLDVFFLGEERALHRYTRRGCGAAGEMWDESTPLGDDITVTARPRAVAWPSGRMDVFAARKDSAVWHRAWLPAGHGSTPGAAPSWSPWRSLGGDAFSPVSLAQHGSDRVELFVLGRDSAVWHATFHG